MLLASALLAGCSVGNGHVCGPQTPQAYCDPVAYERLLHPPPYASRWTKPGESSEGRMKDWVECGGHAGGGFSPSINLLLPLEAQGLSRLEAHQRLEGVARQCMFQRGYVWR